MAKNMIRVTYPPGSRVPTEIIDGDWFETDPGTGGIVVYRHGFKKPIAWYSAARIETIVRIDPVNTEVPHGENDNRRRSEGSGS